MTMDYGNAHGELLDDPHLNNPLLSLWTKQDIPIHIEGEFDQDQLKRDIGLDLDTNLRPIKPNLEGVVAFDRIWETNDNFLDMVISVQKLKLTARSQALTNAQRYYLEKIEAERSDLSRLGGTTRNAFHVLRAMQQAHPITVDPNQINVLPDWESIEEAVDYATHVRLPFKCIFLDCELPTRATRFSESLLFGDRIQLLGGLAAIEDETLILVPFVRVTNKHGDDTFKIHQDYSGEPDSIIDVTYFSWGAVSFNLRNDPSAPRKDDIFDNSEMLRETDTETLGLPFNCWDMDLGWLSAQIAANNQTEYDEFKFQDIAYQGDPSPCRLHYIPPAGVKAEARIAGMSSVLLKGASEMLKVLYFLDTPNVELGEAHLSRQVRRQAERSGATIAKTVFVKHNSKRYQPKNDDSTEHIEFSHQFEVRGHWKYYPEGTRTADARPDLLRYVPGRGMCRKIWCPPFIKGDPDKPLVIKTRRVREEQI